MANKDNQSKQYRMQSSLHPRLTAGSTAHRQQGSAKPTRIKAATMLQKAPMPTLFVSTSSVKHST